MVAGMEGTRKCGSPPESRKKNKIRQQGNGSRAAAAEKGSDSSRQTHRTKTKKVEVY
jgi:hypothetical protein